MVTYIYKIISMKWVSDGQRPKTCRGCGWIFFHSCHKLWCGPGQERPFFNCEKRACKAKSAKNVVIFGEKSPKISDRHINNRLYNYEKVQNLMSFSIITERFLWVKIVIFYTEILTGKVVLWCFFLSGTSEKIHNSTF